MKTYCSTETSRITNHVCVRVENQRQSKQKAHSQKKLSPSERRYNYFCKFLDLHVTTQTYGKTPENAIRTSIITIFLMSGLPWYELVGLIIPKICDAVKISHMNNESHVGRVNKPSKRYFHRHVCIARLLEMYTSRKRPRKTSLRSQHGTWHVGVLTNVLRGHRSLEQ